MVGRNVNYTNVCWVRCSFCNFYRTPGDKSGDSYVLSREQIFQKLQELTDVGGVEVLMQGGLNPKLKIEWYEELLSAMRERFPHIILHCFSPAELIYIKNISKLSMAETLTRLKNAGLHSIPGGGAEILVDRVRQFISPYKDTAAEWLDCMRVAHQVGLYSTATMMYGSVDTMEERIQHFISLRDVQDESQANSLPTSALLLPGTTSPTARNLAARGQPLLTTCGQLPYRASCSTIFRIFRHLG